MNIVLNAYNLKVAGGLNVALNFLKQVKKHTEDTFFVFAPANCGYEDYICDNIYVIIVPTYLTNYFFRPYLENIWLAKKIKDTNPDVIFSMGNFALPLQYPQALLFHYPYLIYPESSKYKLSTYEKMVLSIQRKLFINRLKYIDIIFPQTNVAEQRLKKYYGSNLKCQVVPNAYTKIEAADDDGLDAFNINFENKNKYLLCLTRYYPHKNVEILIHVGEVLKRNNSKIRILTTVSADQHKYAKVFLDNIERAGVGEYVINIGPIRHGDIPKIYRKCDGLILPTLLESFTATYVDSMHFQKPIFTSQLDFAEEICQDAAFYFDPTNAEDIFRVITTALNDKNSLDAKVKLGLDRVLKFPEWEVVANMYLSNLKKVSNNKHVRN